MIQALARLSISRRDIRKVRDHAIEYFRTNAARMQYAHFRQMGLFVGSGVIEAGQMRGWQTVAQSGMHWTVQSECNVLALRCLLLSQRWDDFWEYRAAA